MTDELTLVNLYALNTSQPKFLASVCPMMSQSMEGRRSQVVTSILCVTPR